MRPASALLIAAECLLASTAQAAGTATFDDLLNPPDLTTGSRLFEANGGSNGYQGVIWDMRFEVVGDAYRVQPDSHPPSPLFGLPASGHWFVTNQDGADGLTLTTTLVLTSAWFGQNEYYGYGGGADQVTISALHGAAVLDSVVWNLLDDHIGQPEPLQLVDTSRFRTLAGITGYRIDRHAPKQDSVHWVADSFVFEAAPVPETSTAGLLALGLGALLAIGRRRMPRAQPANRPAVASPSRRQ